MVRFFIAHRVSGEDYKLLEQEMKALCHALQKAGHSYYCSFLDLRMREEKSKKVKITNAFREIDKSDQILAILKSDDKSEGTLIEVGYGAAKGKKIILLCKNTIHNSYVQSLATQVIEFNALNDVYSRLGEIA